MGDGGGAGVWLANKRLQNIMQCGKNMGEKNGVLSGSLRVVHFIPLKFFRRGRLSIASSLWVMWLCCLDYAFDSNSLQRGDHLGPGFIRVPHWKRPQGIFMHNLQKTRLRLRR